MKSITAIYISHFFIISTNMHVVAGFVAIAIMLYCRSTSYRRLSFICISFYNFTFIVLISRCSIAFYKSSISLFELFFLFILRHFCNYYSVVMLCDPFVHYNNRMQFCFHLLGNFAFIITMRYYNNSNKHLKIKIKIDSKREIFDL